MYTVINFKTKKALKDAIAEGKAVRYFQPGPWGGNEPLQGTFPLEGPHYPEPHKWCATGTAKDGLIVKIK